MLTAKELTSAERRFLEKHTKNVILKGPHDREELLRIVRRSVASGPAETS